MKIQLASWGLVILSAILNSYAAIAIKWKFNHVNGSKSSSTMDSFASIIEAVRSPLLVSAGISLAIAILLWFLALSRLDLTVAYPVLVGLHLVFILLAGILFLDEPLTPYKLFGTVLIFMGLLLFYKQAS